MKQHLYETNFVKSTKKSLPPKEANKQSNSFKCHRISIYLPSLVECGWRVFLCVPLNRNCVLSLAVVITTHGNTLI